ncbi:unnamed protein product [Symbiodinium natans]|uniref:WWE domain-containing protein n=1 Tax=Symbiodinium natans TaxID=878477 RepID=A0A812IJ50_9DINO|nr:unnamed protein product [Symbiodinium natans]
MKLPLAVYFPGLGDKSAVIHERASDWAKVAPEPFLLVAPERPRNQWWFLNDGSELGWVRGNLQIDTVDLFCDWIAGMSEFPGVDRDRIGVFGFSAGAYAVAEVLARARLRLCGAGLGGVHGHGQGHLDNRPDVPGHQAFEAQQKFSAFLERLAHHGGARWIGAVHGKTDQESDPRDAQQILEALGRRQGELGLPQVSVRWLEADEQDFRPTKKRNRSHHSYFDVSFVHAGFFRNLFSTGAHAECWWPPKLRPAHEADKAALPKGDGKMYFQWDAGSNGKKQWRYYSNEANSLLVSSYAAYQSSSGGPLQPIAVAGHIYVVDFAQMEQISPFNARRGVRCFKWT